MNSNRENSQLVMSYELIALFRWLIEHNQDEIKNLIQHATNTGLTSEITLLLNRNSYSLHHMQQDIGTFFTLLEQMLFESFSEQIVQKAIEHNLMPSIDQIDTYECDNETVRSSIEHTTNAMQDNPSKNPREQLYKELLLNWNPGKKHLSN